MLPRFSCGSELDYLLLEHVVFLDDLEFCLRAKNVTAGGLLTASWLF